MYLRKLPYHPYQKSPCKLSNSWGPKAAFLGAAIDAPKKNIDVFVDEATTGWAPPDGL